VVPRKTHELKGFLQHIRDVPERSWREEREAVWEIAIRRWVAILDTWTPGDSDLLIALHDCAAFKDKAQILVDVFFNKAPQTLTKRVNSLQKLCNGLQKENVGFPCNEDQFYGFLKRDAANGAPPSRLKSYFEAVVFARYVLGLEALKPLTDSRRCLGATMTKQLVCPRQADPFTVKQLQIFHEHLRDSDEIWNKVMCGMVLFCVYARARWSDAQHAEGLLEDTDEKGILRFLEAKASVHKTARAFHLKHQFLPMSAPSIGITDDNWGVQWMHARRQLKIDDLTKYPLLPAPDSMLEPTRRPVTTREAKLWMHELLGDHVSKASKTTSHSCKCTCLSFLAKRGVSFEDRLILGYHSNHLKMALVYSRDSAARPLALLSHVLGEIRQGIFEPDCTRSGRLKEGAVSLDKVEAFAFRADESDQTVDFVSESKDTEEASEASWQKVGEPAHSAQGSEPLDAGHVTTDSSDSSAEEFVERTPVVGHYTIDVPDNKALWLNQNSRMFHLAFEDHVKVLLCGRRITMGFKKHRGSVRYDSAKCKQCFRLKDS